MSVLYSRFYASFLAVMIFTPAAAIASPVLEVKFHMGLGGGVEQSVGGTLANSGDSAISRGFVVVTPVDDKCSVGESAIFFIGALQPGEEQQFRIPVLQRFSHYRLNMAAFDEQGFEVPSLDANKAILDERLPEQRENCMKLRIH